jgi:anti-sigma regulatory factor (Ser/Thr protein kinase)
MCVKKQRNFPCEPQTTPDGRRFVADALREWGLSEQHRSDDSFDDVLLVTSELVTNAIEACFSEVDVEVTGHCDCVEVSVTDDNPGQALLGSLTPTRESRTPDM